MHMVTDCVCSRSDRRFIASINDGSTPLCNSFNELTLEEFVSFYSIFTNHLSYALTIDSSKSSIWILSARMITPDDNIFHIFNTTINLLSNLCHCSVLVESCKTCDVLFRDIWCKLRYSESVCVAWISNDKNLYCLLSVVIECFTLYFKYICV